MWKLIRIGILLAVLAVVAANAWLERRSSASWRDSLYVGIFPVAADDREATRRYIANLGPATFRDLEPFFAREAHRWGVTLERPFRIELYPAPAAAPPAPPAEPGPLATVGWSLRMRFYAWRFGSATGRPAPDVRMFVLFHDPATSPQVPHSIGLSKGRLGLVHAFASEAMTDANSIVVAHEALHTVGASDKYDPASNAPRFPDGYADPEQQPRYPQARAEIMAGRRAVSPEEQEMPDSLDDCVVGEATATEIGWLRR